jgi:hypothetical protein
MNELEWYWGKLKFFCEKGNDTETKEFLLTQIALFLGINNIYAFYAFCEYGHLELAKWIIEIRCDNFKISHYARAFWLSCKNGHLHVCQWLLQVTKEKGKEFDISYDDNAAIGYACLENRIDVVKWLQSLRPYSYVVKYNKMGKITGYEVRSKAEQKREQNWQQRKYLAWLASNHCPEQNKGNMLYRLPSDVSRLIIGFV